MGKKISLIKTHEELEAEKAQKQRELELEVQAQNQEQQNRIVALHKKQKTMKIIMVSVFAVFFIAMLVFGTYNTFFKHVLNANDIQYQINGAINTYPVEGLDNYIRDNCQGMFMQNVNIDQAKYEYIDVDENSVYISKVRLQSNTLAEVWFAADVKIKERDTKVTDQAIIDRLHKNGFGAVDPTPTPVPTDTPVPVETQSATTPDTTNQDVVENVEEMSFTGGDINIVPMTINYDPETPATTDTTQPSETQQSETQPTETQPAETTPAPTVGDDTEIGSVDMTVDGRNETVEYYIVGNGVIYQRGKITTVRYNFYVPIEYYSVKDADEVTVVAQGYRPAAKLNMYILNDINQTEFDTITINDKYSFENIAPVEENVKTAAKIKVNAILDDLYSGRDTSQSFYSFKTFNTYGATYGNMEVFEMYTEKNAVGFNTYCEYTIITEQGFKYTINTYMVVEPVGSGQDQTWKITRIL